MALVTHQMQGSFVTYPPSHLSWSKGMKLNQYVVGTTESCSIINHNICLSVGASPMRGPKLKPLRVSTFKGNAQNDKSGGRKGGSKLPKNSVKLKENQDTKAGSPQVRLIASVPGYHTGNNMKKWGHMKLHTVLQECTFDKEFRKSPLAYQFPTNVTAWICQTLVTSSLLKDVGVGSFSGSTVPTTLENLVALDYMFLLSIILTLAD